MTAADYLAFIFPASKLMPKEDVATALAMAEGYIAECLPIAKQQESQALYAAYLLEEKEKRASGASVVGPAGPLIQEKEGQLERRYADASANGGTVVDNSFYGRWKALSDLCQFGAIVTRFG